MTDAPPPLPPAGRLPAADAFPPPAGHFPAADAPAPPPPSPLHFRGIAPRARRATFSPFAATLGISFAFGVTLLLGWVVPLCEVVFKDFRVQLSAVTMAMITLSRHFRGFGWVAVWLVPVAAGFLAPLLSADPRQERRRTFLILFLAFSLLTLLAVIAFAAPMMSLINGSSAPRAG